MANLRTKRKPGAATIPGHLTILSVSWLNARFKAVSVHRGVVEATYEHPVDVQGTNQFEELLKLAVNHTGYRGQTVSLVLAHARLAQQMLDVPPVKGPVLAKVVERQARQQNYFVADAAWAYQTALSAKGTQRVVLHLFPRALRNQLIQGARRNKLHLVTIVPPSAVLQSQLMQLPYQGGEFALLAAETAGSTTVVVGREDGQLVLARTLPGTWNESPERFGLDLNRSVLFVSQQYGVTVNSGVWLFGAGARERAIELRALVQTRVEVSPVEDDPFYWATEVLKLQPGPGANFISPVLQKAPQRGLFAKVVAAAVTIILLGCLAVSGFLYTKAREESATIKTLSSQWQSLQARHKEMQQRSTDLARKEQLVNLVLKDRSPPVPVWFLGYLGEAMPPELVVTNLNIRQETNQWRMRMSGTFQKTDKARTIPEASNSLALLKQRLAAGPFHVQLASGNSPVGQPVLKKPSGPAPGFLSWVTNLVGSAGSTNKALMEDHFDLEGVMR